MASLFGSVASEVGGTVKDIALQKRDDRLSDADHQRELQLQKQRMAHDADQTTRRIDADDTRERRRQEFEETMYDRETDRRSDEASEGREHDMSVEELKSRTDIVTTFMSQYYRNQNRRATSTDGWNVEFGRDQQVFDPATNGFVLKPGLVRATAPTGRPYDIVGEYAFPAGGPQQIYPFESVEQQRGAEQALYDGNVTVEQFRDDFGYVPSDFIFGKVTRDEPNLRREMEAAGVTMPAWMAPQRGDSGRGAAEQPARDIMENGASGGPEMQPSIEELSDGPARDAHIAAQGGRTNAELAAEMRAEAQGGGALSEAANLEQGGQLDAAPAAESPYGFVPGGQEGQGGGELSDEDAAAIASAINLQETAAAGMAGKLPGTL